MGKEWDRLWAEPDDSFTERPKGGTGPFDRKRASYGTDTRAMQQWHQAWATEALRVLKPGGHLLAAGGTRTFHRLVSAIEDAGFEIRDTIAHMYGSGFPKSHNLTGDWEGFGTALKPAFEPWTLARKPLSGTVAQNVLTWGTGALNIDGTRIGMGGHLKWSEPRGSGDWEGGEFGDAGEAAEATASVLGRWPSNVALDPEAAAMLDEQSGERPVSGSAQAGKPTVQGEGAIFGSASYQADSGSPFPNDSGGASRFFYCAKSSRGERNAGLDGFEERDGAAIRPKSRRCRVCGTSAKEPGPNGRYPNCEHDDWEYAENQEARHKGALRNAHPT